MAESTEIPNARSLALLRRIGWSTLSGFVAFSGSALLDDMLKVSLAEQLVLTTLVGGVTLLVQYLAEFERRLRQSEANQREILTELHTSISKGFAGVSEATELVGQLDRSALPKEALHRAIWRAGLITTSTKPLLRSVAAAEFERVSEIVQSFANGHEWFYDGEDRDILLALARRAQHSILATSWATDSPQGLGFESGFWMNDLGGRYLNLQRSAIQRGVVVQRVFIVESEERLEGSEADRQVITRHREAGVEVRILRPTPKMQDGTVSDYVLFDEQVVYDTTPVGRGTSSPWLLTTRVTLSDETVRDRVATFRRLWNEADAPDF